MREYVTPAIVLAIHPHRGNDRVADLFTRDFGRLRVRIPGGAKILSKFSPHLSVLNIVSVRLARKNAFTVTDAIRTEEKPIVFENVRRLGAVLNLALLLRSVLPPNERDLQLWHYMHRALYGGPVSLSVALRFVGYDGDRASCVRCGSVGAKTFVLSDHSFMCEKCRVHVRESEVLLIN